MRDSNCNSRFTDAALRSVLRLVEDCRRVFLNRSIATGEISHRLLNPTTTPAKPSGPPEQLRALSIVTSTHSDLASELVLRFRINPLRATSLVLTRLTAVSNQVQAWPFRGVRPRNLASWIIQAIENDYEFPKAYLNHQEQQQAKAMRVVVDNQIRHCPLCDARGFRYVQSSISTSGAMRKCSHNAEIENKHAPFEIPNRKAEISPDAQNSLVSDETDGDEKSPAEESTSP